MADINAIAEQIQGLTLLEASSLVKLLEVKEGISKDEAETIKKKFVDAGATVEVK